MTRRILKPRPRGFAPALFIAGFLLVGCSETKPSTAPVSTASTGPDALALITAEPRVVVEDQLFGGESAVALMTTAAPTVGPEFDVPAAFAARRPVPLRFVWPAGCRVAVRQRTTSTASGAGGVTFVLSTAAIPGSKNLAVRIEDYSPTGAAFNVLDDAARRRVAAAFASFSLTIDPNGKQVGTVGVPQAMTDFVKALMQADATVNGNTVSPGAIATGTRFMTNSVVLTMWDGLVGSLSGIREVPTMGATKVKLLMIDNAVMTARAQGPRLLALRFDGAMSRSALTQLIGGDASPEMTSVIASAKITSRTEFLVDPATLRAASAFEKSAGTVGGATFAFERATTFDWRNSTGCA